METEEEEVKREATEPEKDRAARTLGLRRRRAPEQPQLSISLSGERNWWGKPRFQNSFGLSPIKHMLPYLASGNNQTIREFLMAMSPYLASRNTQRPITELQANNNRLENLAPSVFSQDDSMNDNDVNQHVTITVEGEQLLDAGESSRSRVRNMETTLLRIALLLAAVELIHMALKERIKWAGKRPILPLSHLRSTYTSATRKPVGTIAEYFGLAGAAWQCVYSTVEYTYTRQEKDNPIKICLLPFIFLLCVVIFKLLVDKRSIDESS